MATSTAANVFTLNDILGDKLFRNKTEPNRKVNENLLVLSCALYRIIKNDTATRYLSLSDANIVALVTPEDRILADKITKHFQQKLLVLTIKGSQLTPFRTDLLEFINKTDGVDISEGYIYPEKYFGIAYKLPYFYFYDLEIMEMFGSSFVEIKGEDHFVGEITLEFIKVMTPSKKYSNFIEYWFVDEKQNKVMLGLDKTNVLKGLFDVKLTQGKIKVSGKFTKHKKDEMSYLSPSNNWKLMLE